ncbi:phosphate ABC transporter ATP-binding protein [Tamilnaduibacter salinus]|uniref:Phosphate ABC transporter ATP-binding protein n=1 Tax=Tamilnaduibacter salinus TaxID=1484056 RepID=A0A2A2I4Q7_9GAMM|nr:phosphate ABC transporter ATP-binding protein [Tamilnaduibacter salinus]PAV26115.1 phosphate ABC transporter ATP-binding protein [Tamilnaduibacter salinus]
MTSSTSPTTAPEIRLDRVRVHYGRDKALHPTSLVARPGEITALVGPSGCGKSTLLSAVNRMTDLVPGSRVGGTILIDGMSQQSFPVSRLRQIVGMVFQHPNPFPLSIRDNFHFPLKEHSVRGRAERDRRTRLVLESVGLWDEVRDRLDRSALQLSGGQQQRLCLARTLVLEPGVLLLDEPCSALDPISAQIVEEHIHKLREQYTILMVTHNLSQARRLSDTLAVFWQENGAGRLIESGPTGSVFDAPANPITRDYCMGVVG